MKNTWTKSQEYGLRHASRRRRSMALAIAISLITAMVAMSVKSASAEDAKAQAPSARITVTDKALHPIDERLFGQFMERPSFSGEIGPEAAVVPGTHKLQPEAEKMIADMRIPTLRFPGGSDVDFLNWTDMIDNVPGRDATRPVSKGSKGDSVTNAFGYDEFLQLCQRNGSDAIIVVNFRDGLLEIKKIEDAALHAASLVAYCNAPADANLPNGLGEWAKLRAKNGHPKPYGVKYFQIGNETWFFRGAAEKIDPEHYLDRWAKCVKAYVDAMKAVDPNIKIIVDSRPVPVLAKVHEQLGDAVYAYALHRYCPWEIGQVTRGRQRQAVDVNSLTAEEIWNCWVACPAVGTDGMSTHQDKALTWARQQGCKIAMTEWNWAGWWAVPPGIKPALDSNLLAKGLGAASFLHAIMRNGDVVCMANQSMLIGKEWPLTAIHVDPAGQTPPYMHPSGMVTMMYSQHHGNQLLASDVNTSTDNGLRYQQPYGTDNSVYGITPAGTGGVSYVDVLATRSDSAVFVHIINRRFAAEQPVEIDLSAFGVSGGEGKLYALQGRLNDKPEPGQPLAPAQIRQDTVKINGKVLKFTLAPRTVTILEVPAGK